MLIVGPIIVLLIGICLYFISPLLAMRPVPTGRIAGTDIYAVRSSICNVYLIKTGAGFIMIDGGAGADAAESALKGIGGIDEIKWIFLTHSDSDHTAGLSRFSSAVIHMAADEFPLINGIANRRPSGGNKMPAGTDIKKIVLLSDNQELLIDGVKLRCISAPGHTPGSMLYLLDDKYLFTGDAFRIDNGKTSVHPFTMDRNLANATIGRLKEIVNNSLIVLTSHYGLLTK